jgi:16S rRNA (guanine(966)-N(2))-methyltransferase RsmD
MFVPCTAALIQQKVGTTKAYGFDLNAACSSFLFALSTGASLIAGGGLKRVAVVGCDVMTSILDKTDRNTAVLFGDGAGAVILEQVDAGYGILDFEHHIDGSGAPYLCMPGGGSLNPSTAETVAKKMHYIHQDGKEVFKRAVRDMAEVSRLMLDRNQIRTTDLALFVPHQANIRIMDAALKRLELPEERMANNIVEYANTTSATSPPRCTSRWWPARSRRATWWCSPPSAPASPGAACSCAGPARPMRIIAGSIKGRRLQAPEGEAVRPTADRAREALFSILQRWSQGPFLDLFAGSGAVALEALSRGYAPVTCVEWDPAALACLKANVRGTDLRVLARDVTRLGAEDFRGLAWVFADPPYEAGPGLWPVLAPRIAGWLAPDGILVWEAGAGSELGAAGGLEPFEQRRYGAAVFHFFRLASG